MNAYTTARGILIFIAGFGCLTGARLSLDQMQHGEMCPLLGPIPACYIVFLGYFCILISAIMVHRNWSKKLFYSGWSLVFLLALFGVCIGTNQGTYLPTRTSTCSTMFLFISNVSTLLAVVS